jgi:hypothetical protein
MPCSGIPKRGVFIAVTGFQPITRQQLQYNAGAVGTIFAVPVFDSFIFL